MTAKVYTVYLRSDAAAVGDGDLVLVREAFSWWAFLLSVPWALVNRMWGTAVMILAAQIMLGVFADVLGYNQVTASALSLGIAVIIGLSACDLRAASLERKGFAADGVVVADNLIEAEHRYLDAHPGLTANMAGAS